MRLQASGCALCQQAIRRHLRRNVSTSAPAKEPSSSASLLDDLKARGLIHQVTSSSLAAHLDTPRTAYLGVDPSGRSLHVGNLVGLLALLHFQLSGHKAIALIGGATGSVGDPSGRSTERQALSAETLEGNIASITAQVQQLFRRGTAFAAKRASKHGTPIQDICFANNRDWIGKMSLLDFLSGPGKRARVGTMLSRESVKSRLSSASGISFTEFSYQLLQAYDFHHLHRHQSCTIQLGGSDQCGNIQSGIEMIRREALSQEELAQDDDKSLNPINQAEKAYGLTWPLLTTSTGEKFGKSAGNAVWLDEKMTSPFEFYQFFLRTTDDDVERYLRIFTFLNQMQINEVVSQHKARPEQRTGQKLLASEVTELVHGGSGLKRALAATDITFGSEDTSHLQTENIIAAFEGSDQLYRLARSEVSNTNIGDLLVASGLVTSKTKAKQIVSSGGCSINRQRVGQVSQKLMATDFKDDHVAILRTGKTGLRVIVAE